MVAVIGDIHGCFYTLMNLINSIRVKYKNISIFAVGDLVDRGNYSFDVMEYFNSEGIKFTAGNHDYMFLYFFSRPTDPIGRTWFYNGFEKTILSYNNRFEKLQSHLDLIKNAPLYINTNDCFISHAGISSRFNVQLLDSENKISVDNIDPLIQNNLFSENGVLWTRDELLNIGKLQVVGHTRKDEIKYLPHNNVVYIDTSVYTGNLLSAVIVENNNIIESISVTVSNDDLS